MWEFNSLTDYFHTLVSPLNFSLDLGGVLFQAVPFTLKNEYI